MVQTITCTDGVFVLTSMNCMKCNSALLAVNLISSSMSSTAIGAHCGAELELWLQLIGEENPGRCLPFTGEKNTVLKKFAVISGEIQDTKCSAGQQPQ